MAACFAPCCAGAPTTKTFSSVTKKTPGKAKVADPSTTKLATATKPGATPKATAAKTAAKNRVRTEAEIGGLSSETADQMHARLNLSQTTPQKQWWIRTGGGINTSRTIGKTKVSETNITTFTLDTEYRHNGKNAYHFLSAIVNTKARTPHSSSYYDEAGYYMFSGGYGKRILPGVDLEAAMAYITQRKGDTDRRMTPVYSLRLKTPITHSVSLDSDTLLVEPWSDDNLVDSRVNLTYKLTDSLGMRFTYIANNILGSSLSRTEWDKSFRVSLVFGRGVN